MEKPHYVFSEEQRNEIKTLMLETMNEYFEAKGKTTKNVLVMTATIIGSLTVILGGAKVLLGWLGFTWMSK